MPKILEDARIRLISVARKQALTNGYPGMTIRSVAQECGYSVGTVYNYFRSKEQLLAEVMLEDWQQEVEEMKEKCRKASPAVALEAIYNGLSHFRSLYSSVFEDRSAQRSYALSDRPYHKILLEQLSAILEDVLKQNGLDNQSILPRFLAESLLTWEGKCPYEDLAMILNKLL